MKYVARIISSIAIFNMMLSPLAQAQQSIAQVQATSVQSKGPESVEYRYEMDPSGKFIRGVEKDSNLLRFELEKAPDEKLRSFKPSVVNEKLAQELLQAQRSGTFSQTLKALPMESLVFFIAMGAVVAGQIIFDYSQNPTAATQHIEHSLSPIGQVGFFVFMYSQGVTSNFLAMYMRNPKFMHMIPYLGMTVGFFAQSYLSQFLMDPNVTACARTWMGQKMTAKDTEMGISANPCDAAYEYMLVHKKIWEFAPGILSMLMSAGIAGASQYGLAAALTASRWKTGVQIAMYLVPGKIQVTGLRLFLVKGLQIGVFAGLDVWLNRKVTYVWKNLFDGKEFHDIEERLSTEIRQNASSARNEQWADTDKRLEKEVLNFRNKMNTWRMTNMADIYESYQYWSQNMSNVTGLFNATYSFYSAFTDEVRNSRFKLSEYRPLEYSDALTGVVGKGLKPGSEDLFYTHPQMVRSHQLDTVKDVALAITSELNSNSRLLKYEKETLTEIAELLNSADETNIGKGIYKLQKEMATIQSNVRRSDNYFVNISAYLKTLGKPSPSFGAGQGWVRTYENAPVNNIEAAQKLNYARQIGLINTKKIGDYFMMQILCGNSVESGNLVTKPASGFGDKFNAPSLVPENKWLNVCLSVSSYYQKFLYTDTLVDNNGRLFKGVIPYAVANILPEVIGDKENPGFETWWKNKADPEMSKKFSLYAKDYRTVVVNLIKNINNTEKSIFNGRMPIYKITKEMLTNQQAVDAKRRRFLVGGPIHNGALLSAQQEELVYISILESIINNQPRDIKFADILNYRIGFNSQNGNIATAHKEFNALLDLIKQIKIVQDPEGNEAIQSTLENADFEEQNNKVKAALEAVAQDFGIAEGSNPTSKSKGQKTTGPSRDLIVTILESYQKLGDELMLFGMMANAASWDKLRNVKRVSEQQEKVQNETEARLREARGARASR